MLDEGLREPAKAVYGYYVAEAALAEMFGVTRKADREGWFRSRLIYMRRSGITPRSGRGKVIEYKFEWVARWFLALLFTLRLGREPKMVMETIKRWNQPAGRPDRTPNEAANRGEATIREIILTAMEPERRERSDEHVILFIDYGLPSEPLSISYTTGLQGMKSAYYYLARGRPDLTVPAGVPPKSIPLVTQFDLTAALSRLEAALKAAAAPTAPQPKLSGLAKQIVNAGRRRRGEPELE